jgi:hypothetical protein
MVLQNTPIIYMHPVLYGMNWNVDLKDSGTGAGDIETTHVIVKGLHLSMLDIQ